MQERKLGSQQFKESHSTQLFLSSSAVNARSTFKYFGDFMFNILKESTCFRPLNLKRMHDSKHLQMIYSRLVWKRFLFFDSQLMASNEKTHPLYERLLVAESNSLRFTALNYASLRGLFAEGNGMLTNQSLQGTETAFFSFKTAQFALFLHPSSSTAACLQSATTIDCPTQI